MIGDLWTWSQYINHSLDSASAFFPSYDPPAAPLSRPFLWCVLAFISSCSLPVTPSTLTTTYTHPCSSTRLFPKVLPCVFFSRSTTHFFTFSTLTPLDPFATLFPSLHSAVLFSTSLFSPLYLLFLSHFPFFIDLFSFFRLYQATHSPSPYSQTPQLLTPYSLLPNSLLPNSLLPNSLLPNSLLPNSLPPNSLLPSSLLPTLLSLFPISSAPPSILSLSFRPRHPRPPARVVHFFSPARTRLPKGKLISDNEAAIDGRTRYWRPGLEHTGHQLATPAPHSPLPLSLPLSSVSPSRPLFLHSRSRPPLLLY